MMGRAAWLGLLAAAAAAAMAQASEADARWADIESRIQYDFYTEDGRALGTLATELGRGDADRRGSYYAALANWRRAQLAAGHEERAAAAAAAQECLRQTQAIPDLQQDAEGLALRSACRAALLAQRALHLVLPGADGTAELARALHLSPRSPRVVLIEVLTEYDRDPDPQSRERLLQRLELAVRLFEAERESETAVPGWGAAEAYAFLGRIGLERGDAVAARAALERALLIAPDFALARRLLARIVG
jgi:hypothetical protein